MYKVLEAMNLATDLWLEGDTSTTDDPSADQGGIQANGKFDNILHQIHFVFYVPI